MASVHLRICLILCLFFKSSTSFSLSTFTRQLDLQPLEPRCLNTSHHLPHPVVNSKPLTNMCSPWTSLSCCSQETADRAHHSLNHLDFKVHHCGESAITEKCHQEFARELCYYSCDPYITPWILKPDRTFAKERLMQVPLCQSECNRWWSACADSFTCVRNWRKHFDIKFDETINATVNLCPENSRCMRIMDIYANSVDFCQTVWDNHWLVTPDSEECIKLSFSPNEPNPNRHVAEMHFNEENQRKSNQQEEATITLILVVLFVLAVLCCCFAKCLFYLLKRCHHYCCGH